MEDTNLQRRKELAAALLSDYEEVSGLIRETAASAGDESVTYYEEAFTESREEFRAEVESHRVNTVRIREINSTIAGMINDWYEFVKNKNETSKLTFPLAYYFRKRSLQRSIASLSSEVSDRIIKNRFVKEKLTILEHQLEIRAMSLARSGESYKAYEKLLEKREVLAGELKYLLPTIAALASEGDISRQ